MGCAVTGGLAGGVVGVCLPRLNRIRAVTQTMATPVAIAAQFKPGVWAGATIAELGEWDLASDANAGTLSLNPQA